MQIDKEILAEKNYTGSRLILIEDEKLSELQAVLDGYQQSINPILDRLDRELYTVTNPLYQEMQELQAKAKEIKEKIVAKQAEFKIEMETLESTERKAQAVKDKMQPIILNYVKDQLDEFEEAKHTVVKEGKIYVEVFDKLEELIKSIRSRK